MRAVRLLPHGGFERIPGEEAHFSQRLWWLEDLLRPRPEGPGIAERVRSWLPESVSLRWFDAAYNAMGGEDHPPGADDCWPPDAIIEAVESVADVLRVHDAELPPHFSFQDPRGPRVGGYRLFRGGRRYLVRGGWGRCVAFPVDERGDRLPAPGGEIDLIGESEIRAHAMFIPLDLRRLHEDTFGPEMSVRIVRATCADHFRPDLEGMLRVSRFAERMGSHVYTNID